MAKSEVVETILTGSETVEQAVAAIVKKYGTATAKSMIVRGEYDVLYRQSRREVTSEQRKSDRLKMKMLEEELAKKDPALLDKLNKQVQATLAAKK